MGYIRWIGRGITPSLPLENGVNAGRHCVCPAYVDEAAVVL